MIKGLLLTVLSIVLIGCSHPQEETPEAATRAFYQQYLQAFADFAPDEAEQSPLSNNSPLLKRYVSVDTRNRITDIDRIFEQEILEADYFTYCQDYAPEWVNALKIGKATMRFGGAIVPVSLGVEEGKSLELMVYLRREDSYWKIYRVRDLSNNTEQRIFDDAAIKAAKDYARANKDGVLY